MDENGEGGEVPTHNTDSAKDLKLDSLKELARTAYLLKQSQSLELLLKSSIKVTLTKIEECENKGLDLTN